METEPADQEPQAGSPAITPTNDSTDSEAENSDDRGPLATPTAATPTAATPGSSALEETLTQPPQGEQEENESTTSSAVALELPSSNGIGVASTVASSRSSINSEQNEEEISLITLRLWLLMCDRLIGKSSIPILRLGFLKGNASLSYHELEQARQVSDIYNLLEERLGSREKAIQRLIYALLGLGHRRNGVLCVRRYREKVGQKPPPRYDIRNELEEFGLCQCLVEICVQIEDDVANALRKYCGRYLLETSSENIADVATLFIEMVHNKKITAEDQQNLAIALHVVNAQDCIECIQKYRLKYGHQKLVIRRGDTKYRLLYARATQEQQEDLESLYPSPRSSRTVSSVTSSPSDGSSRTNTPLHHLDTVPEEQSMISRRESIQQSAINVPAAAASLVAANSPRNGTLDQGIGDGSGGNTEIGEAGDPVHGSRRGSQVYRQTAANEDDERLPLLQETHREPDPVPQPQCTPYFSCKITFVVLLSLVLLGGGIALISVCALSDYPSSGSQLAYGNTSAVVATFSTLNVDSISLIANNDEISREMYIDLDTEFYYDDSCSHFEHVTTNQPPEKGKIVNHTLKEIQYFLEGSILSYYICSAANVTVGEHIHFYILDNLQETFMDDPPYDSFVLYKALCIGLNESVSNQTKPEAGWKCYELTYTIERRGYYPVVVFPPLPPPENTLIKYWYQANITQRSINTSVLTPCNPSSNQSLPTCHPTSHLPLTKSCIIAHVTVNNTESKHATDDLYVNIDIQYHNWTPGLPLFIVAGVACVVASVIPCAVLYRYQLKKRVRRLPSDFMNSLRVSTTEV